MRRTPAISVQTMPKPNAASLSLPGRFPNGAVRTRNADIRLHDRKIDSSSERNLPLASAPSLPLPTSASYPLAPSSERPLDRRRIIVTGTLSHKLHKFSRTMLSLFVKVVVTPSPML